MADRLCNFRKEKMIRKRIQNCDVQLLVFGKSSVAENGGDIFLHAKKSRHDRTFGELHLRACQGRSRFASQSTAQKDLPAHSAFRPTGHPGGRAHLVCVAISSRPKKKATQVRRSLFSLLLSAHISRRKHAVFSLVRRRKRRRGRRGRRRWRRGWRRLGKKNPTEEEEKQREEERQREERKREESRRSEAARRRLGITVVAGAGDGDRKRPVYDSRKHKLHPKHHDNAQSEADARRIQGLKPQLEEEQSNASLEEDSAVSDALRSREGSSTGSSEEDSKINYDDDDAWENKSLDEFDVPSFGDSTFAEEETEEKHVISTAPVVNSENMAKEIEEDQIFSSQDVASSSGSGDEKELRAPICCILGHVDAGKTKLLDCIRRTKVQQGEAGGITQQIGTTYLPVENIRERTSLKAEVTVKVPGLLVIDTPGHESFSKMRSRGSSLCDIAVVVVDITRGLEKQTIESLDLLKRHNVRFIVALNKVDRLYGWKPCHNAPIAKALKNQSVDVQMEYRWRLTEVVTQFKENGFNTALYYENKKMKHVFNIVPTSAKSCEGIPDLLLLLVRWVPEIMIEKLVYDDTVECTVLEVNEVKDLGATIDVVLINGVLHQGDQVIVCTEQGPVTTVIKDLLTPHPMKELKAKGIYKHHKELRAAQGVKIVARGLQHAMAGTSLVVVKAGDDLQQCEAVAMQEIDRVISMMDENVEGKAIQEVSRIRTCKEGVYVQASSIGTLEAIIAHLKRNNVNIAVSCWNLGPVNKEDVIKATAMLKRKEEYAAILAFDVKVMPEAAGLAAESGVKILMPDTVYKLVDSYTEHINEYKEAKKMQCAAEAIFPCTLKILPNRVYHSKDPIVCDVEVQEGVAKVGTAICVCIPSKDRTEHIVHSLGRISSIKTSNGNQIFSAKQGVVSIKEIVTNELKPVFWVD
ncbi:eukaryotic translation initiation factor 5B [Brachypodium distachyon]|nr:eukaryotic translation initiation factor 5B [Brachypodium distachyon]|eukprot:XP_014757754.2 eukaryotic translation initiation factor 5B [Brachypodium distachyon]